MTNEERTLVDNYLEIIRVIYATICEMGIVGAPCSVILLVMQNRCPSFTLENYNTIERTLLVSGMVRKEHDCLYAVEHDARSQQAN